MSITCDLTFDLVPVPEDQDRQKPPTHHCMFNGLKIGEAWRNVTKRGIQAGGSMFVFRFSDPDLPLWARSRVRAFAQSPDDSAPLLIQVTDLEEQPQQKEEPLS